MEDQLIKKVAKIGFYIGSSPTRSEIQDEIQSIIRMTEENQGEISEAYNFCFGAGSVFRPGDNFQKVWKLYQNHKAENKKTTEIVGAISVAH